MKKISPEKFPEAGSRHRCRNCYGSRSHGLCLALTRRTCTPYKGDIVLAAEQRYPLQSGYF